MKRKMKLFGIAELEINGCRIHTCNVAVKDSVENRHIVKTFGGVDFRHHFTVKAVSKKGVIVNHTPVIKFELTTMETSTFIDYTKKLGIILKAVAQNNLNEKYGWVNDNIDRYAMQA
jgi:hypothetical protein